MYFTDLNLSVGDVCFISHYGDKLGIVKINECFYPNYVPKLGRYNEWTYKYDVLMHLVIDSKRAKSNKFDIEEYTREENLERINLIKLLSFRQELDNLIHDLVRQYNE
jgi:hypothetical protein